MRKRRVIIFNDEPRMRNALEVFFQTRNYETMIFREPIICPVYGNVEECPGPHSCGDIVIMSNNTPRINGIDLIMAQQRHGCKLSARNKAILAGALSDEERAKLAAMGSAFFQTPLDFGELERWVTERAVLIDLDRPVAIRRREDRQASQNEKLSVLLAEDRIDRVTVVDKSTCGICFRTSRSLMTNQIVTLHEDSAGTTEDGLVRWVNKSGDGTFLVGISFCI